MPTGARIACLIAAVLVFHLTAACSSLANGLSSPVIDPAVRTQISGGSARVIVELRLPQPFRPEGELRDAAEVSVQQRAIAAAQRAALSRLAGTQFRLVRTYSTTPFLALEIGPNALSALQQMGDVVVRVVADELAAPSGALSAPTAPPPR